MKNFIFILFILLFNTGLYSNNLFDSTFYTVEFISDNIEDTKIKKINEIKEKTILSIFKKILIDDEYQKQQSILSDDLINTFIKNIIINDEKIINNKYFSKIKINFNKNKIVEYFRRNQISYNEYYPDKFVLIIYEENELNSNLFSKNNTFYSYINERINEYNYFLVPNLDINDRFIIKKEDLVNKDYKKLNKFSIKYNTNDVIILFAKIKKKLASYKLIIYSDGKFYEKKLLFDEYDLDSFFKILENESLDLWKKNNKIQNTSLNILNCNINYYNMSELKEIRNRLKNVSIIKDLNITSLAYKDIEYQISFYGNNNILIKILEFNKLKINKSEENCIIRLK